MINRSDFICAIGYQGDTAIVDGKNKKLYGKMTTMELAEEGLYKSAVSSAVYSGDEEEQQSVVDLYNSKIGVDSGSFQELMKIFGVFEIFEHISKVKTV